MSTINAWPHVTIDAAGRAKIGSTRYQVLHLATEHYHHGWTAEELLRQHPDLRPEEVYSALAYFYDHFDEFLDRMNVPGGVRPPRDATSTLSRDELTGRSSERTD